MVFNAIYPLRGIFSTQELNLEIRRFFKKDPQEFCLEENSEGLFWNHKRVIPELRHLYFPNSSEEKLKTEPWVDDDFCQIPREKEGLKEVWVEDPRLFRSEATNWLWVAAPMSGCYVTPGDLNSYIETLFLQEDYAVWERFIVTDNPGAEDTPMTFDYYETPDGNVIISDVKKYTEQLTIPKEINHKPVMWASIPYSAKVRHLRKLVVQEGVKRIDFCWSIPELEEIVLPSSTALIQQPKLIKFSQWYINQPVGPVYLANWYLGYRGPLPKDKTLRVRNGTLGIISDCDRGAGWRRIILPESMTYMGEGSFSIPYKTVDVVSQSEVLSAASDPFLYGYPDDMADEELTSFGCENGKDLYNICLKSPELRSFVKSGYFPLPPQLRYVQNKWVAEFLLTHDAYDTYHATFELESGRLEHPPIHAEYLMYRPGYWTKDYLPPAYLRAIEYLDYCVQLINSKSAPEKQDLQLLDEWWQHLVPKQFV